MANVQIKLTYEGADAASHQLDFYDASVALIGFQRSLAIVTHLVVNGTIITQAPSLKNARIMASPPRAGSWEIPVTVVILAAAAYKATTAPKDSPLGHLVRSAYDFVVASTLGFHVDYEKSLGQQYKEIRSKEIDVPVVRPSQIESAIEKCEVAIRDMHRPIVFSETAEIAKLSSLSNGVVEGFGYDLSRRTYDGLIEGFESERPIRIEGRVSSYNMNTFKGRIYIMHEQRPIPFEIMSEARSAVTVAAIAQSLSANARSRRGFPGVVEVVAVRLTSRTGRLKGLRIASANLLSAT